MTIKQLYYLMVAARCTSLAQAAQALGITPRSLRLALGELENALGFVLIDDMSKRVQLTENGQCFLARAEKALDAFAALKALVPAPDFFVDEGGRGSVLYSNPSCISAFLGALMNTLYEQYPAFPISLQEMSHQAIFRALLEAPESWGMITVARDYFNQFIAKALVGYLGWQVMQQDEIMAVVSAISPLARWESIPLGEFMRWPLALNDHFEFTWMNVYGVNTEDCTVCLKSSNEQLIWQFIKNDRAVGFCRRQGLSSMMGAISAQGLVVRPFKEKPQLMLMTIRAKHHQNTLAENVLLHAVRNMLYPFCNCT